MYSTGGSNKREKSKREEDKMNGKELQERWKLEELANILVGLMKHRILFLGASSVDQQGRSIVTDIDANRLLGRLLYLEAEDPTKDIALYINSPGGSVTGMLALYDTIQYIKPDVSTICAGQAVSAGALLLAAGKKGKRFILPNAKVMIHQPSGGASGTALDVDIEAKELMRTRQRLNEILAKHTGQPLEKIEKDTARNFWMDGAEAKAYGIIDKVLTART
jgi:ATP-dependent Clp protease protease subunit